MSKRNILKAVVISLAALFLLGVSAYSSVGKAPPLPISPRMPADINEAAGGGYGLYHSTGDGNPDFSTSLKTVSPAGNIAAGGVLRYTIAFTNTGDITATNVIITDVVPIHTTFLSAQDGGVHANGVVTWTVGTVPPDNSGAAHFRVQVNVATGTLITNVACLSSDQTALLETNVTTNTVALMPDFGLSYKTATVGYPAQPGDLITYTVVYTNGGTLMAGDVVITDPVPAGTTYVAGGVCTDGVVHFDLGIVDIGAGGSVSFTVSINESTPVGTVITNTATIVSGLTLPVTTDAVTTTVIAPVLTLHKAVTPTGSVQPNTTLTYTLTYTNSGNLDTTGVTITDSLPVGLVYLEGGDSWDGETVHWDIGTLQIGASGQVTFIAWITDGVAAVHNRAYLRSDQRGVQSSNVVTTPVLVPVLQVRKMVTPSGNVRPNALLTYTLHYTNVGMLAATGAVLHDPLPAGVKYIAGGIYTKSTNAISFPLGTVLAGESDTVGFTARVSTTQAAVITNTAQVFYDQLYSVAYVSDAPLDVSGSEDFGPIGGSGGLDYVAQSFVATAPRLKRAGIYIYGYTSPYPDVRVQLWGDAAGDPDPTNVLAIGDVIADLTSAGQRYFINPRYPISLTVGARYWLVIDGLVDTSSSGNAGTKYATGNPYADGNWVYSNDGGNSWTVLAGTTDLDVRIEYMSPPQSNVVTTTVLPILQLSTTALSFWAPEEGGANPAPQSVAISNSGVGQLNWSASKSAPWLSISPTIGTAPSTLVVSVTIAGLHTGTYTDTIIVDGGSGTANSPQSISVALRVGSDKIYLPLVLRGWSYIPEVPTRLQLSTTALSFSAVEGGANPALRSVAISNSGGGQLNWSASKSEPWLSISPFTGTAPSTLVVSVTVASLNIGTYTDTITIDGGSGTEDSPQDISVVLRVGSGKVYLPLVVRNWPPIPDVPTLNTITNGSEGSYTVSWSTVSLATSYVLEEATDATFTGATEVYTGTETSYPVSGKGAARYCYRVKARNSWGDSGWSNVESVDVLWEAEPNNSTDQANGPLQSDTNYYGYHNDASDYFSIYVSTGGQITIDLTNYSGGGIQFMLYCPDKPDPIRDWVPPYHIEYTGDAGWYYIRIYTASGYNSDTPYTLRATFP